MTLMNTSFISGAHILYFLASLNKWMKSDNLLCQNHVSIFTDGKLTVIKLTASFIIHNKFFLRYGFISFYIQKNFSSFEELKTRVLDSIISYFLMVYISMLKKSNLITFQRCSICTIDLFTVFCTKFDNWLLNWCMLFIRLTMMAP